MRCVPQKWEKATEKTTSKCDDFAWGHHTVQYCNERREVLARTGEEVGVESLWTVEHAVDADGLRRRLHDFADRVLAKL
jgi:hypothetical protein